MEAKFEETAQVARGLQGLSDSDRLVLYGLYKQVTCGPPEPSSRPPFYDFVGKAKWDAWDKQRSLSKEDATAKYIELVNNLTGVQGVQTPQKQSTGVVFSRIADEEAVNESQLVKFIKEGNIEELKKVKAEKLAQVDEEGQTLLHWAVDSDKQDIVKYILNKNPQLMNCQNNSQETPLHMAVVCEHWDVAGILINAGASFDIKDAEGMTPLDYVEDEEKKKELRERRK
jgi:acyl-CoA-binding protein